MINNLVRKSIEVDKKNITPLWEIKQEDECIIKLSLYRQSKAFDITGQALRLGIKRKDKTLVEVSDSDSFIINGNELDIKLKNSISAIAGPLECDLELSDSTGKMTTASFFINVKDKVLNGQAIEGTNEFDTFSKTVAKVEEDYNSLRKIIIDENQAANLQDQVNQTNAQLETIEYNIDNFPRLNNETNDYDRITRALKAIPQGSILKFNNDKYDLGYKDIEINKRITIKGVFTIKEGNALYGTFFENGGIVIKSNNVTIEKVGVNCPTMDNAFEGNLGSLQHIKIVDCVGIAKDHSYLFESYRGLVEDITIENCTSYNSEHGFILKCNNSIINNCKAYNHNGYGYGLVADNIPNADQVANCRYNKIINSYAENCNFGISCYSTDHYSNTNQNNIRCSNNNITNININNCTTGIMLGSGSETPTGKTYNKLLEFNVTDCNIIKGKKSIFAYDIGRLHYSTIRGGTAECDSNVHSEYIFRLDTDINTIEEKSFSTHNIQILPTGTTPMLNSTSNIYRTNNTEKTPLYHIGHGKEKMLLYILIDENNTTIETTDYIKVNNKYKGKGSYVILKYEDEKWYEVVGYCVPNGTHQYYLEDTDLYIDTRNGDCYDIALSKDTSNKIYIDQNIPHSSNVLNIIVRSVGGEYTFGGFGDMFVLPTGIDYRVNWNQSLSFQFIKFNATGKWVCMSYFDNIPII